MKKNISRERHFPSSTVYEHFIKNDRPTFSISTLYASFPNKEVFNLSLHFCFKNIHNGLMKKSLKIICLVSVDRIEAVASIIQFLLFLNNFLRTHRVKMTLPNGREHFLYFPLEVQFFSLILHKSFMANPNCY